MVTPGVPLKPSDLRPRDMIDMPSFLWGAGLRQISGPEPFLFRLNRNRGSIFCFDAFS
jgi:hypothetical protein